MSLSLGLSLTLAPDKGVRLFPQASAGWDFVRGAYKNAAGFVRTNLAVQSRNLASGSWQTYWAGPTSRTANAAVAPDGTNTATRIVLPVNPGSQPPGIVQVVPIATGVTSTVSVWLRGEVGGEQVFLVNDDNGNGITVTLTTSWQRYWSTGVVGSSGGRIGIRNNSTLTAQTIYAWEAQAEPTGYPTSNIPTTTAAASVTTYSSTNPADVGNMTFTRASTGYAEDAQGNLVLFGPNVPRITNKGVLIEEGRANLLLRSGDITNATWVTANGAIKSNSGATPPGLGVATLIDFSTATPFPLVVQYATGTAATAYKWSIWLWATGSDIGKTISLDGENVSEPANGRVSITLTSVPTRYSITITPTTTTLAPRIIKYNSGGSQDTANSAIAWGAQLEAGSFATSYIPTTSASVTRPADVFKYTGINAPSPITIAATASFSFGNQSAGTYEFASLGSSFNDSAAILRRDVSGGYQGFARTGGVSVADVIAGGAPTATTNTLAFRNADNNFALAKDGTILGTDVSGTAPTFSASTLGVGTDAWGSGSGSTNGYIQRLAIYPFAASDAQLQSISSGNF